MFLIKNHLYTASLLTRNHLYKAKNHLRQKHVPFDAVHALIVSAKHGSFVPNLSELVRNVGRLKPMKIFFRGLTQFLCAIKPGRININKISAPRRRQNKCRNEFSQSRCFSLLPANILVQNTRNSWSEIKIRRGIHGQNTRFDAEFMVRNQDLTRNSWSKHGICSKNTGFVAKTQSSWSKTGISRHTDW